MALIFGYVGLKYSKLFRGPNLNNISRYELKLLLSADHGMRKKLQYMATLSNQEAAMEIHDAEEKLGIQNLESWDSNRDRTLVHPLQKEYLMIRSSQRNVERSRSPACIDQEAYLPSPGVQALIRVPMNLIHDL
jgi:hypothetical protein